MAIQDDFAIDYVDRKITFTTAFVDDRPASIYTVNELYSWLQDTFDEPAQMNDLVPMSAQTPTQYTLINGWFVDDNSMKALYGGSIQTSGWLKSGSEGVTALRWTSATSAPTSADVGKALTGDTSGATGVLLYVDPVRDIAWVRNTSATQFVDAEVVDDDATGIDPDFTLETTNGVESGESVFANLFSVGSLQTGTEIYVGQEDDYLGGRSFHGANQEQRRLEKIDEWWDSDVDFATGSPNLLGGAGHFDVLVKVQEAGASVDGGRLAIYSRQHSKVYSHFELVGGVGNFVVPFSSTGADLNALAGPYSVAFSGRSGTDMAIGDILENDTGTSPVGRLRAVVRSVTGAAAATGTVEYYLIGENEPLTTTDRTLKQLANLENLRTRGASTNLFAVNGAPSVVTNGPADAAGVTITFANAQADVNEDATTEEYACTIDCNSVALSQVYTHVQFLTSRGNQDGTVADAQDTLLPSATSAADEAAEFYRGVGDVVFAFDGGQGTFVTEGDFVENVGQTASGVVVSSNNSATGLCVLTQVKGTFADGEQVAAPGDHATNRIDVNGSVTSIVDNTAAPFGTFAGGRWFVSQGVLLINVPTADANNWETVDLGGSQVVPPTQRTITFAGLVANDRAAIFEVDTAGGTDITTNQNTVGGAASVADTTLTLGTTVALDVPLTGWVRVVDVDDLQTQYRYEYSTVSGTTVTFRTGAGLSGTTTGAGSATSLVDATAFGSFGTDGFPKIGMEIRNVTDGSRAVVLRAVDANTLETTPLTGGTDDTWESGDSWIANDVVTALTTSDTVYFGFIDDVASGTSLSALVKYVHDTDLIARARFSDPDIGGTRILPFQQTSITLTDANLTVTAIRTSDPIAS